MRHSQNQKYRGTSTTLMSLPPKVSIPAPLCSIVPSSNSNMPKFFCKQNERTVEVTFSSEELKVYQKLEKDALSFYESFRERHRHDLSKYFLQLSQKLNPMRVACSGGRYPLDGTTDDAEDNEGSDSDSESGKRSAKKNITYSDYEFTSKFNTLITELERIRDEDPTCKSVEECF